MGYIVHHYSIVERVKFEKAILPSLLLPPDIVGKEATKFGYGRRVLRSLGGGDGGGELGASHGGSHGKVISKDDSSEQART